MVQHDYPTLQARYINTFLNQFSPSQEATEEFLRQCGLKQTDINSDDNLLDLKSVQAMLELVHKRTNFDELTLGYYMGSKFNLNAHGPIGIAGLSSETFGDAVDVMVAYFELISPVYRLERIDKHSELIVVFNENVSLSKELRSVGIYALLSSFHLMLKMLLQEKYATFLHRLCIHIPFPEPVEFKKYRADDMPTVKFCAKQFRLVAPIEIALVRLPFANSYAANQAKQECECLIGNLKHRASVKYRVGDRLQRDDVFPSAEQVAEEMGVSSRTLHRMLAGENAGFREMLLQARMQKAQSLLQETQHSITEVAHMVGYADSANFSRAFKKACGCLPKEWRKDACEV